jgi:hypothetical protein
MFDLAPSTVSSAMREVEPTRVEASIEAEIPGGRHERNGFLAAILEWQENGGDGNSWASIEDAIFLPFRGRQGKTHNGILHANEPHSSRFWRSGGSIGESIGGAAS